MRGGCTWRFDCTKNQGQDNKMIITALDNRLKEELVFSSCHGIKSFGSEQSAVLQIWQEKMKNY